MAKSKEFEQMYKLQLKINNLIVAGMNQAGQLMLRDMQDYAPIDTGRLVSGFRITKPATTTDLEIRIENPVEYGVRYYPRTKNQGRRPRIYSGRTPLFASPETPEKIRDLTEREVAFALRQGL